MKGLSSSFFISKYSAMFEKKLNELDDTTKHIIKKNKQLNEVYDLFLDFIIDSSQHLELVEAKNIAKEITDN